MSPFTTFASAKPWPPLKIERPNSQYANEMLSNIGSCNSEMSTVSLYLYNNIILSETNRDFAEIFLKINIVEMHHLQIFAQLARMLGADPRLWSYGQDRPCYWSPACNHYPKQIKNLLENSLQGEQNAILKYRLQTEQIQDGYVTDLINRIILDAEVHVEILREMLKTLKTSD